MSVPLATTAKTQRTSRHGVHTEKPQHVLYRERERAPRPGREAPLRAENEKLLATVSRAPRQYRPLGALGTPRRQHSKPKMRLSSALRPTSPASLALASDSPSRCCVAYSSAACLRAASSSRAWSSATPPRRYSRPAPVPKSRPIASASAFARLRRCASSSGCSTGGRPSPMSSSPKQCMLFALPMACRTYSARTASSGAGSGAPPWVAA
mmetsp:Transcript_24862/g.74311  ORF Transcript_24862/g.74311 Transcript_24862/m.74311 type:complete len:210 (-) Transcript_24862:155-784(-)